MRHTVGEQLPLEFAPTGSRLPERIVPMQPTDGAGPFDDPGYFFEPWWPGIRTLVLVEGGAVRLRAQALGDPTEYFPELAGVADLVRGDGVVLDATLMVLDARGRPSRTLLDRRLRGETVSVGSAEAGGRARADNGRARAGSGGARAASGRAPTASGGPSLGSAALVASDLLYVSGASLAARPFGERRGELAAVLGASRWCLAGRGFIGDGSTVATALGALGFRALSARRLDAPLRPGPGRDAWYRVPLAAAPRELPPFLAVLRRLPL